MTDQSKYSSLIKTVVAGVAGGCIVLLIAGGVLYDNREQLAGWLLRRAGLETIQVQYEADSDQGGLPSTVVSSQEALIIQAVKKAQPAVVSIVITKDVPVIEQYYDDPFDDFFGSPFGFQIPQYRENGTERREVGGGSGFFVSPDGLIITNRHVVADTDADYTVFTNAGERLDAEVVARDAVLDLAVLKVHGAEHPYLTFADSGAIQVGQNVIAIGNALAEFRNSVSVGIVSGLSRSITASGGGGSELLDNVIQTDAAINPGNSGGPLLDLQGNVIGVNVAVAQGSENIGFALPGNNARDVVDSIQTSGRIIRPFLGIRYLAIDQRVQELNNLEVDYGALIIRGDTPAELAVTPGSPADKAGLEENDIILEIDGVKIDSEHALSSIIRQKKVGQAITIRYLHDAEERTTTITLDEAPE